MLSILLPTYNRAHLVGETIARALQGMRADDELVIRDNASTDGSQDLLVSLAAADQRIRLELGKDNLGPVGNWHACLQLSRGDRVKLLFSDDLLLPAAFASFYDAFERSGCAVAFSSALIGTDVATAGAEFLIGADGHLAASAFVRATLRRLGRVPVSPSAFLFEKECFARSFNDALQMFQHEPEALTTGAGIDLLIVSLAVHRSGGALYSTTPHVFFRQHAGSISTEKSALVKRLYNLSRVRLAGKLYGNWACGPLGASYVAGDSLRRARRALRTMVRAAGVAGSADRRAP